MKQKPHNSKGNPAEIRGYRSMRDALYLDEAKAREVGGNGPWLSGRGSARGRGGGVPAVTVIFKSELV